MPVQNQYYVEQALTPETLEEAFQIRFEVFVKEQYIGPDTEGDELDLIDTHWLVRDETGFAIATARLTDRGEGMGKIERIAVLKPYRQQGAGCLLIETVERDAKIKGFSQLLVHVQTHCQAFFQKQGYLVTDPEIFEEDNIPHVRMEKTLA